MGLWAPLPALEDAAAQRSSAVAPQPGREWHREQGCMPGSLSRDTCFKEAKTRSKPLTQNALKNGLSN